jgi:hypothetical protein
LFNWNRGWEENVRRSSLRAVAAAAVDLALAGLDMCAVHGRHDRTPPWSMDMHATPSDQVRRAQQTATAELEVGDELNQTSSEILASCHNTFMKELDIISVHSSKILQEMFCYAG